MAGFISPIIGGVGSLLGGIFGGSAANKAGQKIYGAGLAAEQGVENASGAGANAINQATQGGLQNYYWGQGGVNNAVQYGQGAVNAAGQGAISGIYGAAENANENAYNLYNSQMQGLNPYLQAGQGGINKAGQIVGEGFHAPTAAEAEATPGFQFQLQQGLNGLEQQFGATGGGATGGALKALTQYGQNVASTYYQNAFNNALQSYNTNLGGALALGNQGLQASGMANQATQNYGNLYNANTMGAAEYAGNIGVGTAEYGAGVGMQGAGINANLLAGAANYQLGGTEAAANMALAGNEAGGNFLMQGAQGYAAGKMGQANAWNGAMSGIGNAFGAMPFGTNSYNPFAINPTTGMNMSPSNPGGNIYGPFQSGATT